MSKAEVEKWFGVDNRFRQSTQTNADGSETVTISKGERPAQLDTDSLVESVLSKIEIDVDGLAQEVLKNLKESGALTDVDPAEFVAELLATAGD